MTNNRFLRRVLLVVSWCMWFPGIAIGAVLNYDAELAAIGEVAIVANTGIALLSGLSALLQRIRAELARDGGRLPNPFVFCAANLAGSVMAGLLGFLLSRAWGETSVWMEMATVAVFAFVGARMVEAVAERVLNTVVPGGMTVVHDKTDNTEKEQ